MNGFLKIWQRRLIFFNVKPLIFLIIQHILFDSYESQNPTADSLQYYFLNMKSWYRNPFLNSHWSLWFDYSQLMKQIPLHLAAQSISHVLHICIILVSSLRSVSLQAPDTKQALDSPSENAAGSEKCANCSLLIHFVFHLIHLACCLKIANKRDVCVNIIGLYSWEEQRAV